MVALRWRGSWTAAPGGGAAAVRFALSLTSLLFVSVLFFLFLFLFSVLVSVFPSLSLLRALSLFDLLSLPLFLQKKSVLSLFFGLPIYRKKHGAVMLFLVRLQSRLAGRFFRWWWGRGERERGGTKF